MAVAAVLGEWESGDFAPFMIPPARNLSFYTTRKSGIGHQDDGLKAVEEVLADDVRKVESGKAVPSAFLDETFTLAEFGDAHACMEDNNATGTVVVTVPWTSFPRPAPTLPSSHPA